MSQQPQLIECIPEYKNNQPFRLQLQMGEALSHWLSILSFKDLVCLFRWYTFHRISGVNNTTRPVC